MFLFMLSPIYEFNVEGMREKNYPDMLQTLPQAQWYTLATKYHHSLPIGGNHLHILLDHHLSPPPHLVGDEDDGDLFGGAHLGDQVAVLHRLVEAVPAKRKRKNHCLLLLRIMVIILTILVPVSDAVADYESLATAHVLLAHCCELNLRGNSLEIDSQKS